MANIIINKDSHLAKTNRLITLDADDVYAFNRSISGLNQSIYGIQPSKDQILNGIDIEDISSNNSLCSDVYFLDKNFDKLKYFAQKSFIICDSYEDVLNTATNPLAIYLTPISSDGFITDVKNNSGKRIFSKLKLMEELSKIKSVDEEHNLWEDIKQFLIKNNYWTTVELAIYLEEDNVLFKSIIDTLLDENGDFKNKYSLSKEKIENTLDKCEYDAFSGINDYYEYIFIFKEEVNWDELKTYTEGTIYLSTLIEEGKGKFELIGSTSLTDEKFSKLFSDVYTKCNEIEDNLSENLSETKKDVNKISGDFKNHLDEYNEFSNDINNKVDNKLEISDLTEENLKNKTDENADNKKIYGRLNEQNIWFSDQLLMANLEIQRDNNYIGDITTGTNSLKFFSKNGNSLDIGAIDNNGNSFDLKIGNNFSFDKTNDKKTNTLLKIEEDKISSSVPIFSEYLNSKDLYTKRILGTEYIGSESKDDLIKLSPNKISVDNNAEVCVNNLSSTHIFANDITLDGNSVGEMRAIHLKDIVIDGKIVLGNHTTGIVDSAGDLNNNEVNLNFGKPIYFLNLDNSSKTSIYGNLSIKGEMCPLYVDGGKAIFGNYTQSIYHILNTSDSNKEFQIHFENIETTGGVANIRILYSENNLKKVEINENGESSSYYVDTLKHIIKPNQCFSFKISISYVGGYFLVKYEPILDSDKYVRYDEFSTHTTNTDNPHSVTASQVGADPAGTAVDAVNVHNTSEDAHADIRAAVATAQSTAESAGDDANRIAGTITTHISNIDNPHSVTAEQVGADPVGTAEANVIEHNTDEAAHGDIRAAVANAQQQADSALQNSIAVHYLAVEVEGNLNSHKDDKNNPHSVTAAQVGADPAGTAQLLVDTHNNDLTAHPDIRQSIENMDSVCRDYIAAHNESSESHEDIRTSIANVEETLNLHINDKENPHSVTELQVSTATTERANRSFIRADYNYAGRPNYIDAKVTDLILFDALTRVSNLFVNAKLQSTYITGWGNAGGHLILEGSGNDTNGLTLRTVGETNHMPGIDINPAASTTIKGDLNIASRAAVTTGSWQKTASAGDLTADGTITAKTGMKVTKTDGETTTDIMSVDSTGMKVSATSVTEGATTTSSMSVDGTGMKVSIGDGETKKDVVSVGSTGLTVDGTTTSTSVVSNSVGTNGLRVYTTGTDDSKQYIELHAGVITAAHSANLTLVGGNINTGHNIIIGGINQPIRLRKGTTDLLSITTSGAKFSVPVNIAVNSWINFADGDGGSIESNLVYFNTIHGYENICIGSSNVLSLQVEGEIVLPHGQRTYTAEITDVPNYVEGSTIDISLDVSKIGQDLTTGFSEGEIASIYYISNFRGTSTANVHFSAYNSGEGSFPYANNSYILGDKSFNDTIEVGSVLAIKVTATIAFDTRCVLRVENLGKATKLI